MGASNAEPITWSADEFEVGDKFAIPPQRTKVYTIKERAERHGLIEFKASLWSEIDEEEWGDFNFTFPADFPLSARRRIRTIVAPCMICGEPGKHELDTAYSTYNNGMCGKHGE
jgi:hypothetical protein